MEPSSHSRKEYAAASKAIHQGKVRPEDDWLIAQTLADFEAGKPYAQIVEALFSNGVRWEWGAAVHERAVAWHWRKFFATANADFAAGRSDTEAMTIARGFAERASKTHNSKRRLVAHLRDYGASETLSEELGQDAVVADNIRRTGRNLIVQNAVIVIASIVVLILIPHPATAGLVFLALLRAAWQIFRASGRQMLGNR